MTIEFESVRLPMSFDPDRLVADYQAIEAERWIRHFNARYYVGDWSGVALRGPAGVTHPIQSLFANPGTTEWEDTELLKASPYFDEVLSAFRSPLLSVRLLRLGPDSEIKEHSDHSLSFESGEVRLHIPILTNPKVEFLINHKPVALSPGELWYLNVELPHSVKNEGHTQRVHMVIDTVVDDWLRSLFKKASAGSSTG